MHYMYYTLLRTGIFILKFRLFEEYLGVLSMTFLCFYLHPFLNSLIPCRCHVLEGIRELLFSMVGSNILLYPNFNTLILPQISPPY